MRPNNLETSAPSGIPAPVPQEDLDDFGIIDLDDSRDLGFEHGNIVFYDDFTFQTTVLSVGWKEIDTD